MNDIDIKINEDILKLFQEKESQFIDEALKEWDSLRGILTPLPVFLATRIIDKWRELYSRN